MEYVEITAVVDVAQAAQAAVLLRVLTGAGVSIEVPLAQPDGESAAIACREGAALLHAYLPDWQPHAAADDLAAAVLARAGIRAEVSRRLIAEEDWAEAWKEHFHVARFGRIVVVPSWRSYEARPGDVVLTLDPGMAFGTGQHETTRMCLEALDRRVRPGARVVDVGCGSGILSIAAAKLGASDVFALDVDPDCVRITAENARANGVDRIVRAVVVSPDVVSPYGDLAGAPCDVVVVNIVASTIVALGQALVGAMAPGGWLIVSGVIAAREDRVVEVLAAEGASVVAARAMGDWRCIEAVRETADGVR